MNTPADEAKQETEALTTDQHIAAADVANAESPEHRRASKFSNLVNLVARPAENSGQFRSSETSGNPALSSLSGTSRKRPDPKTLTPQSSDEAKDIGRFVFFHGREKRYLDGLRRKTIPLKTSALSLSLGVAIGCVVAIALSLTLRVYWYFHGVM